MRMISAQRSRSVSDGYSQSYRNMWGDHANKTVWRVSKSRGSSLVKVGVPQLSPLADHPARDQRGERLLRGTKSPFECPRVHAGEWREMAVRSPTTIGSGRSVGVLHLSLKRAFKIPTGVLRVTSPSRLESKNMAFIRAVGLASDAHIGLRQKLGRCCEPLQHRQFFVTAGDVVSSVLSR